MRDKKRLPPDQRAGDAVHEALKGLTQQHPATLAYAPTHKIVYRRNLTDFRREHVTTIGFSGSGQ